MPTEFYNEKTEAELHQESLRASAEIAEQASMLSLKYGWTYERACEYVLKTNPELGELQKHGYVKETPAKNYSMTSYEAGEELAAKVKKLQREKNIPFDKAHARVFAAEENAELVKIYAFGD
jgi:hypothetical protein